MLYFKITALSSEKLQSEIADIDKHVPVEL
jgi:hypothetical protein